MYAQNSHSTDLIRGHGGHEDQPLGRAVMRNGQSTADRLAYAGQSALAIATVDSKGTTTSTTRTDSSSDSANLALTKSIFDFRTDSDAAVGAGERHRPQRRKSRSFDGHAASVGYLPTRSATQYDAD